MILRGKTHQEVANERAGNGAHLLDENYEGWADKVDLEHLYMGDCASCVLGQLFGSYFDSPRSLRINDVVMGFDISRTGDGVDYNHLRTAWIEQVQERQFAWR